MACLFSGPGLERFNEIVKPGLLCAFDFDGTLAPIVPQPERASLPAELKHRLQQLSALAPVAIITGRSLDDIRARLGFAPDYVIGNHGIEGLPGWETRAEKYRELCALWRADLAGRLDSGTPEAAGISIENKRYSLSMHYRMAPDPARAESWLAEMFSGLDPRPRIISGKYVFNLLPEDAGDKGRALEQLMQLSGARTAVYAGDDVTDEDVFRLRRKDLLSVRIGQTSDSAAEFFLQRRQDMEALLDRLTDRLNALGAHNWQQQERASNA